METRPTLYKRDSKGKIRVWFMELDGDHYRTTAGLQDGQLVTSEWTVAKPKNVGKANETSGAEQAQAEVDAQYKKKLKGEYHESVEDVDNARWFKPMLAQPWEKRFKKITFPCFFQPKLDGIRCIADRNGLWTRTGEPIVAIPHIREALAPLFEANPDAIFDGELYNHELNDNFNKIGSICRKQTPTADELEEAKVMQYHMYDLPSHAGSFGERIVELSRLIDALDNDYLRVVSTAMCDDMTEINTMYEVVLEKMYEGGIIRLDESYEQKRSNNLIKRKEFEDDEFEITAIEEGEGNWSGRAKVIHCRQADGLEFKATLKGTREYCAEVLQEADEYIGMQVTVEFFTRTPDGVPRFPRAKALHKDKRW
jgi:DNA ligase-1